MIWRWLTSILLLAMVCCAEVPQGGKAGGVVVLDIGHFVGRPGAHTPGPINGRVITECEFWYRYAPEVKKVITAAGFKCVITNRGHAPTVEPYASYARRAKIVHLNHPDKGAVRYPSRFFPDRVSSGMVSADYAVQRRASCIVFLHHNSGESGKWQTGEAPSVILCNKHNGHVLAQTLCDALNSQILNHGMDNAGRECTVEERSVDADRAAGWLNTCDDAGIPAAVIEAAFLTTRAHAAYLAKDANARKYAQTIGQGIVTFLREHGNDARHYRADLNEPDEGSFGYAEESRSLRVPGAKLLR